MSPRPRTTLIIAVIAQAAVSVVQFGLPAIGVEIQNKFGLGPAGFGAVFAAVGLGSAVALIPAGMLVDRFGARPVLLIGAAINFCAYLAASAAPNAALFAAAIFLAGIGSSAVPVAGMSSLLREFPPHRRGIALGWRQLAVPLGGAIGAAALPLLAHIGGVRLALIVTAVATASTASVFAWLSAAGGGTARRMRLDGALTARGMRSLLVVGLLYVYALAAALTYIVAAARDDGLGKTEAGALFVVLNLSAGASRLVWGRIADRGGGNRRVRTLIDCGMLAAVAGLAMAPVLHVGVVLAVPVTIALGFGCFGWNGVLYVTAGELVGPDRAARAVGVASTMVFGAGALAAPVSGLVAEHAGYDVMWLTAAASSAAGAAFAWRALAWMRRPHAGAAVGATAR
ncbi:MAG TPA: MFS transporter [Gaiellales bacterium]|jgi:MFS family permease|nr:MFS transporter [Gaiellales bacterium]